MTALAASNPLFGFLDFLFSLLSMACFIVKAVMTPLAIGLLYFTERLKIELKTVEHIKSKWGVFPFITQPSATKPSNLFMFFLMAIGISKVPGTFKILILN